MLTQHEIFCFLCCLNTLLFDEKINTTVLSQHAQTCQNYQNCVKVVLSAVLNPLNTKNYVLSLLSSVESCWNVLSPKSSTNFVPYIRVFLCCLSTHLCLTNCVCVVDRRQQPRVNENTLVLSVNTKYSRYVWFVTSNG